MRTSSLFAALALLLVTSTSLTEPIRAQSTSASQDVSGLLAPSIPIIYLTPARLNALRAEKPITSPNWHKLEGRAREVDETFRATPARYAPYYGPEEKTFLDAANASLSNLPYLALTCIVEDGYCETARRILLSWASASPNTLHFDNPTEENLSLGRYMGQIAESYSLLATHLSSAERATVTAWIRNLGSTIQRSQQYWYEKHAALGPQNHITWGEYGIAVAGLVAHDRGLIDYAFSDPSNGESFRNTFHLRTLEGILQEAVYADGNPNIFFERTDRSLRSEMSPVRDGELVDRDRHIHCGHDRPNGCGLGYSMFSLSALTYTAYLADENGITDNGSSFFLEKNARSATSTPVLQSAMQFYGNVLANDVSGGVVEDPAYAGENIECGNLGSLLIGENYYPSIRKLVPTIVANCRASSSDPQYPLDDPYPLNGIPLLYLAVVFGT